MLIERSQCSLKSLIQTADALRDGRSENDVLGQAQERFFMFPSAQKSRAFLLWMGANDEQ